MAGGGRALAPLLALVATLALTACGADGGGSDAAGTGVTAEQERLDAAVRDARDEVSATLERLRETASSDAAASELEESAARLRERADALEQVEARDDLREPRDRLAAGLRRLADEAEAAARAASAGDWQGTARGLSRSDAVGEIERALGDLRERGVDVEPLEEARAAGDLDAEAQRLQAELDRLFEDVSAARSTDEAADAMTEAAERLREAAESLHGAEAEPELEDARDETADAAGRLAAELERVAPAAREGDVRGAIEEVRSLEAVGDVRRRLDELRRGSVQVEGAESAELEVAVRRARDEVEAALADLARSRSTAEAAERMEAGAARVRAAATEVEHARAEGDADRARTDLVEGLHGLADELEAAAPEVRDGSLPQALQRTQALESVEDVDRSLEDLRREGVDVPTLRRP